MKTRALLIGVLSLLSASAQTFTLVPNGDFEPPEWPGTVSGFTLEGDSVITSVDPIAGTQSLRLPAVGDSFLVTIDTPFIGQECHFRFFMRSQVTSSGTGIRSTLVSGGVAQSPATRFSIVDISDSLSADLAWTATASSATIRVDQFAGTGWVDTLQTVVPEPSTYAAVAASALLGFALLRRLKDQQPNPRSLQN